MLHHIGMLTLATQAGAAERDAIVQGLSDLVGVVPGLLSADVRADAGLKDGNADLLFTMAFGDEEAWRAYGDHPAHQAVVKDHIAPVLAAKAFLQVRGDAPQS